MTIRAILEEKRIHTVKFSVGETLYKVKPIKNRASIGGLEQLQFGAWLSQSPVQLPLEGLGQPVPLVADALAPVAIDVVADACQIGGDIVAARGREWEKQLWRLCRRSNDHRPARNERQQETGCL